MELDDDFDVTSIGEKVELGIDLDVVVKKVSVVVNSGGGFEVKNTSEVVSISVVSNFGVVVKSGGLKGTVGERVEPGSSAVVKVGGKRVTVEIDGSTVETKTVVDALSVVVEFENSVVVKSG